MPNPKSYTSILLASAMVVTGFTACDSGKDKKTGSFELRLTDAPLKGVDEVLVTFDEIAVRRCVTKEEDDDDDDDDKGDDKKDDKKGEEDNKDEKEKSSRSGDKSGEKDQSSQDENKKEGEDKDDDKGDDEAETKSPPCVKKRWLVLSDEEMTFDLLKLRDGKTKVMASDEIEAGTYNEVRLKLTKAQLVIGGKKVDLDVPSGMTSGLKVPAVFVIDPEKESSMTVDFDAAKSLKQDGKGDWKLMPVLKAFKPKTKKRGEKNKDD